MTRVGSSSWYSVNDGELLNDVSIITSHVVRHECSAFIKGIDGDFYCEAIGCRDDTKFSFICQKKSFQESLNNEIGSE